MNGDLLAARNYQGAVPDVKMMEFKRAELRDRFDELYRSVRLRTAVRSGPTPPTRAGRPGLSADAAIQPTLQFGPISVRDRENTHAIRHAPLSRISNEN